MNQAQFEARLKTDFRAFVMYVWSFLGLPAPTPNQLDICEYLSMARRGPSSKPSEASARAG